MRQVAHSCATLGSEKTLKSPLDGFSAENQRSNRRLGQADRVGPSRQRPSVTGSEPVIRIPGNQRGRNRSPPGCHGRTLTSVAPSDCQSQPASFPAGLFPRPPPLRDRRFAGMDSYGLMDQPKISLTVKRLIFGKCLFVRLFARAPRFADTDYCAGGGARWGAARMCPRACAINSLEFPERTRRWPKGSNEAGCDRWRIFASLCVTLATETTPKSPLFEPFVSRKSVVESPKWRKGAP
jgi:hypothetical protein